MTKIPKVIQFAAQAVQQHPERLKPAARRVFEFGRARAQIGRSETDGIPSDAAMAAAFLAGHRSFRRGEG